MARKRQRDTEIGNTHTHAHTGDRQRDTQRGHT